MCNLYWITTNQVAILALFKVMERYVGNLPPIPGVFPDYPAPPRSTERAFRKSSSRFPELSCAVSQRGCFPRPDQVSKGSSGFLYFENTCG